MGVADFLGNVGASLGGQSAMGVNPAMVSGQQANSIGGMVAGMPGAPQMPPPRSARRTGVKHFLGQLGDALLVGAGGDAIYGPKIEREEIGNALAQYVGSTDATLADIMRRDPATGFALLKMKMDAQPTGEEWLYFDDNAGNRWRQNKRTGEVDQAPSFVDRNPRQFVQDGQLVTVPNSYASGQQGGQDALPAVSDAATYAAVPPGGQYRDPDGNVRTKPGGTGGNASGGFLR